MFGAVAHTVQITLQHNYEMLHKTNNNFVGILIKNCFKVYFFTSFSNKNINMLVHINFTNVFV